MKFNYDKRQALLYLAKQYHMSLATAFFDMVLWSKYGVDRFSSARVVLSPFLFRYLLKRDLVRIGISAAAYYTSHFLDILRALALRYILCVTKWSDIDTSLHGFAYRVEFPSGQMTLF